MGRPSLHRREEVVERALRVFWTRGYEGTTMRDLSEALDLRPGSIYHAFGGKDQLYAEALEHYARSDIERLRRCREEAGPGLAGLYAFTREVTGASEHPRACFLVRTMLEAAPPLSNQARGLQSGFAQFLDTLLDEEVEAGRLAATAAREPLKDFIVVQLSGVRVFADTHRDDAAVQATVELVIAAIEAQREAA